MTDRLTPRLLVEVQTDTGFWDIRANFPASYLRTACECAQQLLLQGLTARVVRIPGNFVLSADDVADGAKAD